MSEQRRFDPWVLAVPVLAFTLALAPRALAPERFITADEGAYWFERSARFEEGLTKGPLSLTWQAPHPGVTTMWCGVAGRAVYRLGGGDVDTTDRDARHDLRVSQRRVVAVVTSLCVAFVAALAQRAWGLRTAAALAGLLAFEPFLIAHSKILHTDALAASFLVVSIVALTVGARERSRWIVDLAAVACALAGLSKLPGLVGLPAAFLVTAAAAWPAAGATYDRAVTSAKAAIVPTIRFAAIVAVTILLVWPATWAAPSAVAAGFVRGVDLGVSPHENGNFFFGYSVDDPGPAFYPIALFFRLSPITLIGLVAGAYATIRRRADAWVPLVAALGLLVLLSVGGKKFDRYALPILPMLDWIAAVGWVGLLAGRAPRVVGAATTAAVAVAVALLVRIHPYEMAWYSPLVGGGAGARKVLLYGWGEGLDQVGDWLAANEPDCTKTVASQYTKSLQPFVCQKVESVGHYDDADYVVFYANQRQRDHARAAWRPYAKATPLLVARAPDGQPLAWLFRRVR